MADLRSSKLDQLIERTAHLDEPSAGHMGHLLRELGSAETAEMLAARFIDGINGSVGADIVGMYVLGGREGPCAYVRGASEGVLLAYEQVGRSIDIVLLAAMGVTRPSTRRSSYHLSSGIHMPSIGRWPVPSPSNTTLSRLYSRRGNSLAP
jgi:hypothetical protein